MNITSKSRYALKILLDMAEHGATDELVQRAEIASRQGIPLDYMDQILGRLREAGLIASTRGRGGGYRLSRLPETVSMLEIFTAVEDAFEPVQCLDGGAHPCTASATCSSRDAWHVISGAIRNSLSGIILADMANKKPHGHVEPQPMGECRAPRKRSSVAHP